MSNQALAINLILPLNLIVLTALTVHYSIFFKIYLVQFALMQEQDEVDEDDDVILDTKQGIRPTPSSTPMQSAKQSVKSPTQLQYLLQSYLVLVD